jgi:hypothetical protein
MALLKRHSKPAPSAPRLPLVNVPPVLGEPAQADHLLEQYKVFVETEESLVSRRQEENRFFLSVNALVLTVLSFLLQQGVTDRASWAGIFVLGIAGLTLCFAWHTIIASYRTLNQAKFDVIGSFEAALPARMFGAEWEAAQALSYQPFTKIERIVPLIFGLLHLGATLVALLGFLRVLH